ncbi:MAG TPA: ABC transporter permease [Mycobacteriales bacterium]|jgi:putative ABC transport system permease protein|nr:ABC transporter permease [Mycobacteriales bacterium]
MIRLAFSSLRFRAAAVLATLLAVLVGTALAIACGGLFETAIRLDAPPQRLAGAPVVVTGAGSYHFANGSGSGAYPERASLNPALARTIAGQSGVARAVPDATFPAVLLRDGAALVRDRSVLAGHAWTSAVLTPYTLHGTAPQAADEVVIDAATARAAGAHTGDRVQVAVDGKAATFTVTGVATAAHRVDASALFFSDARGHRPQAIGVFPAPGTSAQSLADRLDHALPVDLAVRSGDARGSGEFAGIAGSRLPLFILAGVFGGLVVVVMSIVVAATITLSVRQRQRELALLRASGATPFQVRRLVITEAMLVAVVGAAGGVFLGRFGGQRLFHLMTGHGVLPAALSFTQGPIPFAAGAVVGLVAVRVAAGMAARPAARVAPIQALREVAIAPVVLSPVRRMLATILAVGTVGLAVTTLFLSPTNASALGGPAVLTGAIALALVAPAAVRWAADRLTPRLTGVGGRLATINLRARAVQFGAVLTPITLATAICLGNIYSQTTQDHAAHDAYLSQLNSDVVITNDSGGITPGLADQVSALPNVSGASELVSSHGWIDKPFDQSHTSDPWPMLGITAQHGDPVYVGHVRSGSLTQLSGQSVALPAKQAADLGLRVGGTVRLRLGDGASVTARIVATVDQRAGYEQILLPARLLAAHTAGMLPTDLVLRSDHPDAVRVEAASVVRNWPGAHIGGKAVLAAEFDAGLGIQAWISYLVAALAIAYAALATVNTVAVSILDRRREFGLQALTGATRRQIKGMLRVEAGIVGAFGLVAGTVIAAFTVLPITFASGEWLPSGPIWVYAATIGVIALLVLPVTAAAASVAMRQRPVEAVAAPTG